MSLYVLIKKLQKLDLKKASDDEIKLLLKEVNKYVGLGYKLDAGKSIYRALRIKDVNKIPKTKERVSYNPNSTGFGRANIPNNTMFYGAITTIRGRGDMQRLGAPKDDSYIHKQNPGYMVGMLECSEISSRLPIKGSELFAIGMWEIKKDFHVGVIANHNPISDFGKQELSALNSHYKELTKKHEEHVKFNHFLSKDFCRSVPKDFEHLYRISAHYANNIIYGNTGDFLGLKYPSVKSDKEGYNVALHPKVVDENYIELLRVALVRIYKKPDSKEFVWDWEASAEYIPGEELVYKTIENSTSSIDKLRDELRLKGIEDLIVHKRFWD